MLIVTINKSLIYSLPMDTRDVPCSMSHYWPLHQQEEVRHGKNPAAL
jgi:hypothetical protein